MSEPDLIEARRRKIAAIAALTGERWPRRFDASHRLADAAQRWRSTDAATLEAERPTVRVAGRILAIRAFGGSAFLVLGDGRATLQTFLRKNVLEPPGFELYGLLDVGDWVGVSGRLMRTRTGELTVEATTLTYLAKALRPLPEKWHGLVDVEARYRQRHLDLIANPEVRATFEARARIVREVRRYFDEAGFVEVETPMMQVLAGGAAARPFRTHHNALDLDLYLRIAPELYLKRLVVGGFERVYEINRNFRNEGISIRHNPEFTMLEFYEAYADYERAMDRVEELLVAVAGGAFGRTAFEYLGRPLDLGRRPFERLRMRDAVRAALAARPELGFDPERLEDAAALEVLAGKLGLDRAAGAGPRTWGETLAAVFEALVEPGLWGPTFIYEYPVEVSPLAKRSPSDPRFVERFELYLGGFELANGFSELNDPDDQRERFEQQARERARGDDEAHPPDLDYVEALEHGLPPTGGVGVGIDRLAMVLTGARSIRDVILFPLLRPLPRGEG